MKIFRKNSTVFPCLLLLTAIAVLFPEFPGNDTVSSSPEEYFHSSTPGDIPVWTHSRNNNELCRVSRPRFNGALLTSGDESALPLFFRTTAEYFHTAVFSKDFRQLSKPTRAGPCRS